MALGAKQLRVVFAVALQDAGEATRSLEIAKGLREYAPDGWSVECAFLSHGSRFAPKMVDAGFEVYDCPPKLGGVGFRDQLKTQFPELVGNPDIAREVIEGERRALSEIQPDLVIYGFWPMGSIARQMLGIPGVCFLPLPLHPDVLSSSLLKDVPDDLKPLTYLPLPLRRFIVRHVPKPVKMRAPGFRQRNIRQAAQACGWSGPSRKNLFDMLRADLTIVLDLEDFYEEETLPPDFRVVGPLFATADGAAEVDPAILRLFDPSDEKPKVLCTMGSSGYKEHLLEAVRALTSGNATGWNSVILASSAICTIEEAKAHAGADSNSYITDAFVPALSVNELADVVVSHGGQGTVQTALACGTPIVGVAMQLEQQVNLDNVGAKGAGIRIPSHRWTASNIQAAVRNILEDRSYRENARRLQQSVRRVNGKKSSAEAIWQFVTKTGA
jgi:UDP:flavonoid glycosyltransferase YjiC (YdhE family)